MRKVKWETSSKNEKHLDFGNNGNSGNLVQSGLFQSGVDGDKNGNLKFTKVEIW